MTTQREKANCQWIQTGVCNALDCPEFREGCECPFTPWLVDEEEES
jgi:hypothetical protein